MRGRNLHPLADRFRRCACIKCDQARTRSWLAEAAGMHRESLQSQCDFPRVNDTGSKERTMFVLKACARCGGDLNIGLDGEFTCIQCGCELNPNERARMVTRVRMAQRTKVLAGAAH